MILFASILLCFGCCFELYQFLFETRELRYIYKSMKDDFYLSFKVDKNNHRYDYYGMIKFKNFKTNNTTISKILILNSSNKIVVDETDGDHIHVHIFTFLPFSLINSIYYFLLVKLFIKKLEIINISEDTPVLLEDNKFQGEFYIDEALKQLNVPYIRNNKISKIINSLK